MLCPVANLMFGMLLQRASALLFYFTITMYYLSTPIPQSSVIEPCFPLMNAADGTRSSSQSLHYAYKSSVLLLHAVRR
jgi:hypothetical protein